MALPRLSRRRRGWSDGRSAPIGMMGAGGILAGTALAWLLWPERGAERRERTGRALRGAAERASGALHGAADRLKANAKVAATQAGTLPARAHQAADVVRSRADRGREALEARGWSPRQMALGVAGGALLGRAVLGRGLLRIPAGLLGASILARVASDAGSRRRMRRAGEAEERARPDESGAGAPHPGGTWREVREVKSPGELEQSPVTGRAGGGSPQEAASRVLGPDGELVTHREPATREEPAGEAPARREPGEHDRG